MKLDLRRRFLVAGVAALVVGLTGLNSAFAQTDASEPWRWGLGVGAGWTFVEKDEEYLGMMDYEVRGDYRFHPSWTAEFGVGILPYVRAREFESSHGQMEDDAFGVRLLVDMLYHLDPEAHAKRWDPYAAVGGGVNIYDEDVDDGDRGVWYVDAGFGAFYYLQSDEWRDWFIKPDYRLMVVGDDGQLNHLALISLGKVWGGGRDVDGAATTTGMEGGAERVLANVYFAFDSSALTPQSRGTLEQNARWLNANPNQRVVIEGHADERGTNEYNLALGQRRADSVFQYLKTLGVSTERLRTISYGEEYPADPAHNEEAWAKNRRVEFEFDGERAVQR